MPAQRRRPTPPAAEPESETAEPEVAPGQGGPPPAAGGGSSADAGSVPAGERMTHAEKAALRRKLQDKFH
jgi:hypothetical protein